MRNYEAVYILKADLETEQTAALVEKFKQIIVDNGGEIVKVDQWGKRRLAYEINKQHDGYYVLMQFNAEPGVELELQRVMKITETVMRYLVIRLEESKVSAK